MSGADTCLVLTFHSISAEPGPTNIPPEVFAMQMAALAQAGYRALSLDQFIAWHSAGTPAEAGAEAGAAGAETGKRRVLITFDDGFRDFAVHAAPVLERHGWRALMFVPTAKVGLSDDWETGPRHRDLMDWDELQRLRRQGIDFGSHSRSHRDLQTLGQQALADELEGSRRDLGNRLEAPVRSFAAPFGRTNQAVREAIARHYDVAFGTRLDVARPGRDRYDIPRLDMHYFREPRQWQGLLNGNTLYLRRRQLLRAARQYIRDMRAPAYQAK